MSKKDGGPAFPQMCADALDIGMVHDGMTLRDWFAGMALQGMVAAMRSDEGAAAYNDIAESEGLTPPQLVAALAYRYADAVIAEGTKP